MTYVKNYFPDPLLTKTTSYQKFDSVTIGQWNGQMLVTASADAGGRVAVNIPAAPLVGLRLEFHGSVWLVKGAAATMSAEDTFCVIGALKGSSWSYLAKIPTLKEGANTPASNAFTVPSNINTVQLLFYTPKKQGLSANWSSPLLCETGTFKQVEALGLQSFSGDTMPLS